MQPVEMIKTFNILQALDLSDSPIVPSIYLSYTSFGRHGPIL